MGRHLSQNFFRADLSPKAARRPARERETSWLALLPVAFGQGAAWAARTARPGAERARVSCSLTPPAQPMPSRAASQQPSS